MSEPEAPISPRIRLGDADLAQTLGEWTRCELEYDCKEGHHHTCTVRARWRLVFAEAGHAPNDTYLVCDEHYDAINAEPGDWFVDLSRGTESCWWEAL